MTATTPARLDGFWPLANRTASEQCAHAPSRRGCGLGAAASFDGVQSGQCLNFAEVDESGHGSCPAKTSGLSSSGLLTGPIPANGAVVSNLNAETNATLSGKDSATVAVIDNATGATLLSCTANATSKGSCSNTGSSPP